MLEIASRRAKRLIGKYVDGNDEVKNAALKAAQDTLEKIGGEDGATTLSPDDGSVESAKSEMDIKFMETWLVTHPNPTTPDELRMAEAIHTQIRSQRG
ncbi:MAG: hypothetical protein IH795_07065 [Bacteroidetes bacterium]|nr:hypothetical protein [Bacteroidota bacterium]